MGKLFKKTYTVKGPSGERITKETEKWYARLPGQKQETPLCRDKRQSQILYATLVKEQEGRRIGIEDPFERHRRRPLAEHFGDWSKSLENRGITAKQRQQVTSRVQKLLDSCCWIFAADVRPSHLEAALASLAKSGGRAGHKGRGAQTRNFYLAAIKQFFAWMVRDGRLPYSPLQGLRGQSVQTDRRHDRRCLELVELHRLLQITRASNWTFRGLTGEARYHLYLMAAATGLRSDELATVTPKSFNWSAEPATVSVGAGYTKNKDAAMQPLPSDVADEVRNYSAGMTDSQQLWPGTWHEKGADMLKHDLGEAGIVYQDASGRFVDFHALRHTYISYLVRSRIPPKIAQQLARHKDIRLTLDRYAHLDRDEVHGSITALPVLSPASETLLTSPAEKNGRSVMNAKTDDKNGQAARAS